MAKKKPKTAKKKVQVKDLKAKKASQVKGGLTVPRTPLGRHEKEIDVLEW